MNARSELPNPYPDETVRRIPVDAGLDALLEDLRGEPTFRADPAPTGRRPVRRGRWVAVAAAAAAVAAAVAVPSLLAGGSDDPVGEPSGPAAAPVASPEPLRTEPADEPPAVPSTPWRGPTSYAVLDAPGWRVASVQTDPGYGVSLSYRGSGERYLDLEWIRERWYADVRDDALAESPSASTTDVLGQPADYVAYESGQQLAFVPVVDGYGLRVAGTSTTEAEFADLVTQLREVDEAGFDAAMPRDVVAPDDADEAVADLLEAAALPPGFEAPYVAGFNRLADISRVLAEPVGCGWAEEFVAARSDGDAAGQEQVIDALVNHTVYRTLSDVAADRGGYARTVALMRADASDEQITGSACPRQLQTSIAD